MADTKGLVINPDGSNAELDTLGQKLAAQENIVAEAMSKAYVVVGEALDQIKEDELFKAAGYEDFEKYCEGRWGWKANYANRQIAAAKFAKALPAGTPHPANEGQYRVVAELKTTELQAEALTEAAAASPAGIVTATPLREAVNKRKTTRNTGDGSSSSNAKTVTVGDYTKKVEGYLVRIKDIADKLHEYHDGVDAGVSTSALAAVDDHVRAVSEAVLTAVGLPVAKGKARAPKAPAAPAAPKADADTAEGAEAPADDKAVSAAARAWAKETNYVGPDGTKDSGRARVPQVVIDAYKAATAADKEAEK